MKTFPSSKSFRIIIFFFFISVPILTFGFAPSNKKHQLPRQSLFIDSQCLVELSPLSSFQQNFFPPGYTQQLHHQGNALLQQFSPRYCPLLFRHAWALRLKDQSKDEKNDDNDGRNDNTTTKKKSLQISFNDLSNKYFLVVGGSGRVGGSVVTQLIKRGGYVTVGGTSYERFVTSCTRWKKLFPELKQDFIDKLDFVLVDREDASSVITALSSSPSPPSSSSYKETANYDLVVHTAGPFQGKVNTPNGVIQACVEKGVPYVDVCDDYCTASMAKTEYGKRAREQNVSCIISTGCWPGVSSLMAKQLVRKVLTSRPSLTPEDLKVDFNFFTAGSGGAGSTLLVATFLILAEKALTIVNGRRKPVQAMREYTTVNFGNIVGNKDVAHLNLLETASVHDILGIGNVETRFGTAPAFWNALLGVMAQLPPSLLANEELMSKLAVFSLPIVRVVDFFAGATNAMRCDVTSEKDPYLRATALYAHENLEPCVGECVAAFCAAALSGHVPAGVWFPEEAIDGGEDASAVLAMASVGAHTVEVDSTIGIDSQEVWGTI